MSGPNGYGPGSLSLLYLNLINTLGYESGTTANGIPYGGGPKSGWRLVPLVFMDASHAALWESTGSPETSVFQTLFAGKTWQVVPGGEATASVLLPIRVS